ncbi:rRNA maturation factor [Loktanella sp. 3ANDIMAR09]|uniref:rRNA maturation RNase YbeY n=1 Tax=Loktanella sp. 3ANDIMAR09 TaxID=1225657 RepID=UPI0006FF1AD8|nr:rRNA maturation RNase YbeY [Loktanella sp. 3ANDIMAR09]KQI67393.1 rRNA maturation factor [Loktanella sp. 3ANDIMAR09]
MTVDLNTEDPRWDALDLAALAEAATAAALAELGLDPAQWDISLLGCDDARIAALNADFRGKPAPTNVLSWPSDERAAGIDGEMPLPPDPVDPELGDIAIAYDTCAREAAAAGKTITAHATHLLVHATLHLLGFDHERDADADLMQGLESQILVSMGHADPYSDDATGRDQAEGQ